MRTRSSVHAQRDTGDEVPDAADDEPVEAPRDQARAHCHPPPNPACADSAAACALMRAAES